MTGNVLFLMSDEHSREIAGCYGNPIVRTPNLDALAARGVVFENAYCNPGSACHRAQASRPGTTSTASATGMARPFRPGETGFGARQIPWRAKQRTAGIQ